MKVRQQVIERKAELFAIEDPLERNKILVNFWYQWSSCFPKNFGVYRRIQERELHEAIAAYEEDLRDCVQYLDQDYLARFAQTMYLLKTDKFENILWRVEKRTNELASELTKENLAAILRSFAHMSRNKGFGSRQTFAQLEQTVQKNLDSFNIRDLSHVYYAYAARGFGNPELHKRFVDRIRKDLKSMDYQAFYNTVWYLVMTESINYDLWMEFMQAVAEQSEPIPLIYYYPFKLAKLHLVGKFGDKLDQELFRDFKDKFWYAEQYFDATRVEDVESTEQTDLRQLFATHLHALPLPNTTLHNTF